ncbi:radical SAM protein [Candidatus Babeliales bacterium]|nr:radical SAM protein [Candidatus Babeliales bacterium]
MNKNSLRLLGIKKNKPLIGPERLEIEIINYCNINCLTCWFFSPLNPPFKDKPWKMELDTFKNIIDGAKKISVDSICVPGIGEPTLHPDLGEMIIYTKKNSLPFHLATNLTLKSNRTKKRLLLCDNIDITFLAPTKKMYDKLQCSKSKSQFKTVVKNIEYIASHKKIKNKPQINLIYIVNKENYLLLENMLIFSKKIGADSLELQPFDSVGKNKKLSLGTEELNHFFRLKNELKKQYPFLKERFFDNYFSLKLKNKDLKHCYMGYFTALVAIKGIVKIGCFHPNSPTAGNIYNQNLKDIWYSDKAKKIRNKYIYKLDKIHKSNAHCPFLSKNQALQL